jgi:hypothetical protein
MEDAVYVSTNESLEVMVISSIGMNSAMTTATPPVQGTQVVVDMRMLTQNAGLTYLTFTVNPTNDYTCNEFFIKLPEGFILSAAVYTAGLVQQNSTGADSETVLPIIGETWVSLSVVISQNPDQYTGTFLCQGYCTNYQRVTYPIPQPVSYADGRPFTRTLAGAAGQGIIYNVPINAINEITGCSFVFQTNATVGNREVYLQYVKNNGAANPPVLQTPLGDTQVANQLMGYAYGIGFSPKEALGTYQFIPLLNRLRLTYGDSVQVNAQGMAAGDQISNFALWGNEWLMP